MIGIPVATLLANAIEWTVHKHLLHGRGKKRGSFWAYHWYGHHRNSRQNEHADPEFGASLFEWNAGSKEALSLTAIALAHVPLLPIAPFYAATAIAMAAEYAYKHRRAHQDPEWARKNVPWHYDHHMGPNQDANFCVTRPWMDHLMGTREPYVGTELEARDQASGIRRRSAGKRNAPGLAGRVL